MIERLALVVDRFPQFEAARIALAILLAEVQPERALTLTRVECSPRSRAAAWYVQARAKRSLGVAREAEALCGRIGQLPADLIAASVEFLRTSSRLEEAGELLALGMSVQPRAPELRRERLRLAWQRGSLEEAAATLRELHLQGDSDSVDARLARRVAVSVSDWKLLGDVTDVARKRRRDSRIESDPWLLEAAHAGAQLALGDDRPRARLLDLAGRHLAALLIVAQVEQRLADVQPSALLRLRTLTDLADWQLQDTEVLS